MPLSEDQRAMLQLLLERGQSYEDIGSLLGLGVDDVRVRARAALTEIAGEDPDAEVGLTDYLLGQADPIGRADAARHLQSDPEANALAEKLEAQLRLLAPAAQLPDLPQARAPRPAERARGPSGSGSDTAAKGRAGPATLGNRQRGLIAGVLAGTALLVVIVLIASGAFDSGNGGSASTTAKKGSSSNTVANSGQVTKAVLRPLGGGGARGVALFGRVKKVPVIQVTALGLDQLGSGEAYYAWLTDSKKLDLPIGGFTVDKKGRAGAQIKIPTQALDLVANKTFNALEITKTKSAEYQSAVSAAARQKTFPPLAGTSILRGKITGPIVGAAKTTGQAGQKGQSGG